MHMHMQLGVCAGEHCVPERLHSRESRVFPTEHSVSECVKSEVYSLRLLYYYQNTVRLNTSPDSGKPA